MAKELGFDGVCENSLDAVPTATSASILRRRRALMTHFALIGRAGAVDEPALRLREDRRSLLHRQLDHAAEEESGRTRTGTWQDRPRERRLIAMLTLMKGQPLAYNKDNQEDKEPLFDTADTVTDTLRIFADMMGGIEARPDNMRHALTQGFATATDLADYLTKKGCPSATRTRPSASP